MEYYRLLNLIREPFPNTPNPDLFFPSRQHRACLQQLEMAVRLRRGLNIVIGDVGSGKTLLSRILIRSLSGDGHLETHLMLDPDFPDQTGFLSALARLFRIDIPDGDRLKSRRIKERIKAYLFQRGVREKVTLTLVIDEGQKLSRANIEILRELLNYETNDYKLLQIVIFAQKEFDSTIENVPNIRDRINLCLYLGPLGFREMRAMIRFRLDRAAHHSTGWRLDFSWPALWSIYRATGGYPRGVVHLCHQCVLLMIVQNRSSVSRMMVNACIRRSAVRLPRASGFTRPVLAGGMVVLLTVSILWASPIIVDVVTRERSVSAMPSDQDSPTESVVVRKPMPPIPSERARRSTPPTILGTVAIRSGETLSELMQWVYGTSHGKYLEQVIAINMGMRDPNRLSAGQRVRFPAIPVAGAQMENGGPAWMELRRVSRLEEAVRDLRRRGSVEGDALKLLPFWNERDGLSFSIGYRPGPDGEAVGNVLPGGFSAGSSSERMAAWPPDTVFFAAID